MKYRVAFIICILSSIFFVSNAISQDIKDALTVSSSVFENNSSIPEKYTCDGVDVNPPILIENIPSRTKSLALIVDDPDAPVGIWVHWVLWNIKPEIKEIKENAVPKGAQQGMNDFGKHNYGGPCPPSGTHRYFFKLYALDNILKLSPNARKADVEKAMKGHIIEQAQIVGLYKRR